ncbi:MAG TPA: SWIM zinc finger family protein [Candidatus Methylacidiphilales bacterium]|nr:SWIM zinc finger family protein [Candidatus Methylacidiphilales bacterium]
MSWFYNAPTPSASARKQQASKKIKQLRARGREVDPVGELPHRTKIATSFWGAAWCKHLESYSDFATRLPRGRSYVRNGAVLHLGIEAGVITALVQGTEVYEETITIQPLEPAKWERIQARCRGKIASLIELLQGRISDEIMRIVTDKQDGLFPSPREIHLSCSCPDYADMCKHVAAVLYGVGARLDTRPELLFKLRGLDHNSLIAAAAAETSVAISSRPPGSKERRRLSAGSSLNDIFGADIEASEPVAEDVAAKPQQIDPVPVSPTEVATIEAELEGEPKLQNPDFHYPVIVTMKYLREKERKREKEAASKLLKLKKLHPRPPRTAPFVHTGNTVKALRMRLDMSHKRLAKKLKVTEQTLHRWEAAGDAKLTIREPGLSALTALEDMYPPAP